LAWQLAPFRSALPTPSGPGRGAAGTAALGIYLFGEPLTLAWGAGVLLIIAGVSVLRWS